eukprot:gene1494-881_t
MSTTSQTRYVGGTIQRNFEKLMKIRVMSALVSGVAAGALGLTGIYGFLFLLLSSAITAGLTLTLACSGDVMQYIPTGKSEFFSTRQFLSGAMTYILAWTVAYDAIYLF